MKEPRDTPPLPALPPHRSTREGQLAEIVRGLRGLELLKSLSDEQLNRVAEAVKVGEGRYGGPPGWQRRREAATAAATEMPRPPFTPVPCPPPPAPAPAAAALQVVSYRAGERIITKGEFGETFYMIKAGRVVCTDAGAGAKKMEDMVRGWGGRSRT